MLVLLLLLLMFLLLLVLFLLLFLLFGFFAALRSAGRRSSGENPCTVHPLWLLIPFSRHIPPHPSFAKEKPTEAFLGMIQRDAKQAHCQTEPWKHFVRYFLQNPGHFWCFPPNREKSSPFLLHLLLLFLLLLGARCLWAAGDSLVLGLERGKSTK